MKNIPAPGNYSAITTGKIVIGEPAQAGGYLIANIPYKITTPDVQYSDTAPCFLARPDETLYTNAISNLKTIFGWDGFDFFALEEVAPGREIELKDCVHRTRKYKDEQGNESEVEEFRVGFVNAPGANRVQPMDESARKEIRNLYSSKLKAISGGKPAKAPGKPATAPEKQEDEIPGLETPKPATATPEPEKRKPGRPPSVPKKVRTATDQEVWDALVKKEGESDKATKLYQEACEKIAPGTGGELTPEQWGKAADLLGV